MPRPSPSVFNCLIRTHHITSRKKLQKVRRAAGQLGVGVLVRSNGSPGLMYGESYTEDGLVDWVAAVQALRYKDFRCVFRPALITDQVMDDDDPAGMQEQTSRPILAGLHETNSITQFAAEMEARRLTRWWKRGMGYGQ
ncbi:hypothetical protein ACRE_071070 [Hapsidospora chrysogenum ATCC 11550]|uniref:Uncharacterized protein n=1 Tax=Hapsidospora chrysogenum (strain ATCC 11550 / CBS 779.69 / DSM 880 / IAM 14645 / JCM 23072 / IMI 49137) TaxID=857340 RepID=A0A086SYJ0_HAPC1|nr:hypothetical protein ACRE_071070 [Hapsidospora chrysogenum ATCC 11550]